MHTQYTFNFFHHTIDTNAGYSTWSGCPVTLMRPMQRLRNVEEFSTHAFSQGIFAGCQPFFARYIYTHVGLYSDTHTRTLKHTLIDMQV